MVPTRPARTFGFVVVIAALSSSFALAHSWEQCSGWEQGHDWGSMGHYCEIRELSLPVTGSIAVDAGHNGGIRLSVPEDYSAELETGTVNGRLSIDSPVPGQGQLGRTIETTLGSGGGPVRITTRNSGVTISRH